MRAGRFLIFDRFELAFGVWVSIQWSIGNACDQIL